MSKVLSPLEMPDKPAKGSKRVKNCCKPVLLKHEKLVAGSVNFGCLTHFYKTNGKH